ncbi:MepB family protein [Flavobacterium sp. K5-23]|uniref:MepB family protein n=1 Tax=Flavobacterium sp. K5-23 TaxID=2746225 RepID=UPI0020102BE9|nr:MepB family protein [Flavobacterium sp. K5-23]UQD56765.1 MepB family protein [Flavobacterium sp. K5-23]
MIPKPTWTNTKTIPKDLITAKELVYDRCAFICTEPIPESESKEYAAQSFSINGKSIKFRVAKTTPTKKGQFVTLWKRMENGPIAPFHIEDNIDFFIISCRKENHLGQFIFSKKVLHNKGILSDDIKEGKRAIRVYPPWDITTSKQAQKTQQWQLDYFMEIPETYPTELELLDKIKSRALTLLW